jgi:hypothetical protein
MKSKLVLFLTIILNLVAAAQADQLFSNYTDIFGQFAYFTPDDFGIPGTSLLGTDLITSDSPSVITGITLSILNTDTIAHSFTVSIYDQYVSAQPWFADSTGLLFAQTDGGRRVHIPGNLVGTFSLITAPADGSGLPQFCIGTSSGIYLSPDSGYSVVVQLNEDPESGNVFWTSRDYFGGRDGFAVDPGSIFQTDPNSGGVLKSADGSQADWGWAPGSNGDQTTYQFSLSGTVVPEPASVALCAAGALFLAGLRRRDLKAK